MHKYSKNFSLILMKLCVHSYLPEFQNKNITFIFFLFLGIKSLVVHQWMFTYLTWVKKSCQVEMARVNTRVENLKKVSEGEYSALKMFLLLIFFMSQLQKEVGSDLGSLKLLLSS